jgi:hypothetical protein
MGKSFWTWQTFRPSPQVLPSLLVLTVPPPWALTFSSLSEHPRLLIAVSSADFQIELKATWGCVIFLGVVLTHSASFHELLMAEGQYLLGLLLFSISLRGWHGVGMVSLSTVRFCAT